MADPELVAVAAGAVLAAVGYVGKTTIDLLTAKWRQDRERRAALVELASLLNASHVAFTVQNLLARRLVDRIKRNYPDVPVDGGLESTMSRAYPLLSDEEREMHAVVRGYADSMKLANSRLLSWVQQDTYFKTFKADAKATEPNARLAYQLRVLEPHLLLWFGKYDAWIPGQPQHALVYLNDEKEHGLEFPYTIDETAKQLLENARI